MSTKGANAHEMSVSSEHWQKLSGKPTVAGGNEDMDSDQDPNRQRLSAEFGTPFTVFIALMIILTMGMLMYGNTTVGAFVSVQVTPKLPLSGSGDSDLSLVIAPLMEANNVSWPPSDDTSLGSVEYD